MAMPPNLRLSSPAEVSYIMQVWEECQCIDTAEQLHAGVYGKKNCLSHLALVSTSTSHTSVEPNKVVEDCHAHAAPSPQAWGWISDMLKDASQLRTF